MVYIAMRRDAQKGKHALAWDVCLGKKWTILYIFKKNQNGGNDALIGLCTPSHTHTQRYEAYILANLLALGTLSYRWKCSMSWCTASTRLAALL